MSIFSDKLSLLMKQHNISDEELAELIDVNRTTINRWRTGERNPKMDKLPEIADIFKVPPQIFIGNDKNTSDLIEDYSTLSPKQQKLLLEYLQELKEKEELL